MIIDGVISGVPSAEAQAAAQRNMTQRRHLERQLRDQGFAVDGSGDRNILWLNIPRLNVAVRSQREEARRADESRARAGRRAAAGADGRAAEARARAAHRAAAGAEGLARERVRDAARREHAAADLGASACELELDLHGANRSRIE